MFSGPDREILTVKNVSKPDDIACFQCGMENDVGSNQQSVCLNVICESACLFSPVALLPATCR